MGGGRVLLIEALVLDGVRTEEIGFITLFKAQQARIQSICWGEGFDEYG